MNKVQSQPIKIFDMYEESASQFIDLIENNAKGEHV